MEIKPLVSVIIPVYNSEKYIKETIKSVLNQTWDNIEIIIVDDGSTDGTIEVVESLKCDKITLLQQKNSGACTARNLGYDKSKGQFIQYLDADDLLSPDKIESQIILAKAYGDENVYSCKCYTFKEAIEDANIITQKVDKSYDKSADWLLEAWSNREYGQTSIWLTPKVVHERAGRWDERLLKNQDGEFFCRVILNSKRVIFTDTAIVYYRRNGELTVSSKNSFESAESTLFSIQLCEKHVSVLNVNFNKAIAQLYYNFINAYHPQYPELLKKAKDLIKVQGYTYKDFVPNKKKRYLIGLLGLDITLRSASLLRKLK